MKKLLCLVILLLCAVACAVAEEEPEVFTWGDFKYVVLEDGTAEIVGYTGKTKELTVPETLDGRKVTAIGGAAFSGRGSLTIITLPDSITSIGANPFAGCTSLTKINVSPEHPTLATIDGVLFSKPDKRLVCYPCAFERNRYTVPQGIAIIGDWAFSECDSLTSITLPDSVTAIGDEAFSLCESLTSITIPNSVTTIGDGAFRDCESLTSITLPDSITAIGDEAFLGCESLTSITLPDSITSIGYRAFFGCCSLTSITLPDSVTTIGDDAFPRSGKLTLLVTYGSYAATYAENERYDYSYR